MSAWYNVRFSVSHNADWEQSFLMKDNAGAAVDLTGATFEMDVRDRSGTEILTLTTANSRIEITNAATGAFRVYVPRAAMLALTPGTYSHDLIMIQAGSARRVWAGTVEIAKGVSV